MSPKDNQNRQVTDQDRQSIEISPSNIFEDNIPTENMNEEEKYLFE